MNSLIEHYYLRVAAHNLINELYSALANDLSGPTAFFDQLVQDDLFVDELEQAFIRNTNLRLVDVLDLKEKS